MKNKFLLIFLLLPSLAQATWQPTHLSAGRINALAISPVDSAHIFAATAVGLYISLDAGATWRSKILAFGEKGAIDFISAQDVTVDSLDRTYVATSKGLYVSPNLTLKFHKQSLGVDALNQTHFLCVNTGSHGQVYLASEKAVVHSADEGQTWNGTQTESQIGKLRSMNMGSDGFLYVATSSGAYRSTWPLQWENITPAKTEAVFKILPDVNGTTLFVGEKAGTIILEAVDKNNVAHTLLDKSMTKKSPLLLTKKVVYIGSTEGVKQMDLKTEKMETLDANFKLEILSLALSPDEQWLIAGTAGKGVWRYPLR